MKKMIVNSKLHTFIICASFLLVLLISCTPAVVDEWEGATVLVMLSHGEGVTVNGDNPIRVKRGEEVVFDITVDENYKISETLNCELLEDKVIVTDTSMPTTASLVTREKFTFSFKTSGLADSQTPNGDYLEDTEITVTAPETSNGKYFIGYSLGRTMEKGGSMFSFARECTFLLTEDTVIYANYASEGAKLLIYNANGGTAACGSEAMVTEWKNSVYLCPNTLINSTYFSRPGYVLTGYNTEPDGSGRFYGCGWNVVMPETGVEELYCQWLAETPAEEFIYSVKSGKVTISGYTGNGETVVIPEKIENYPVTGISADAFTNKDFKTLYISKNVKSIVAGAVKNCNKFETLYLTDNVIVMSDGCFENCNELSKLYLIASTEPRYQSSRNGTYQIKYERLMTADAPKMVITGGSNVAYGVDSERLQTAIGNAYNVVNYGCNQSTAANFYIEVIAYWAKEGDILLHCPELASNYQFGYNEINTTLWQIFEGAYDAFSCVDIRNYTKLFSSFADFNSTRSSRAKQSYENYTSETVNMYGDYIKTKKGQTYTPSYNSRTYNPSVITGNYVGNINRAFALCRDKGMTVYLSFGVVNKASVKEDSLKEATQLVYKKTAANTLDVDAIISEVSTYVMESQYFYNSDLHLGTEGSRIRTDNLAADLLKQFAKDGNGKN